LRTTSIFYLPALAHERILRAFSTIEEVGKETIHEGMLMLRRHFKCHRLALEVEDKSIFPWHVDNGAASPGVDGIFLIEHAIQEEPVFGHLRDIGQAEGGAKEMLLVVEEEVSGRLVVIAGETGAHFLCLGKSDIYL
jgi:hypothetical protein